jgi:hypothetical protein
MQNDERVKTSRRPGRPKSEQVKIRQYFYLTESELHSLQAVARERQLSVSSIVRAFLILQI